MHPLYKKLAVCNPDNYKGIQLISQLSKVVERTFLQLIGRSLALTLTGSGALVRGSLLTARAGVHETQFI
eukprot:3855295-Pyramimonas_sp.AAC.1